MDPVEQLIAWAEPQGIKLNGLTPKALPGRGIGLVATRDIAAHEIILTVPTTSLRTLSNTPPHITNPLRSSTVHAILTTSLCLETSPSFRPWAAVLPTRDALTTAVPLSWPPSLQAQLPPLERTLLKKQQAKFDKDWVDVRGAFPELQKADFQYHWLLVNTRTFYHTNRTTEKLPKEDHMVLQPVADLFNHSPGGCTVAFTPHAFTITTVAAHAAGDEMFIRYGTHSNAFLLVEYGFTLPVKANPWDETSLDAWIAPLFEPEPASATTIASSGPASRSRAAAQRAILEDEGWWGGWMLDSRTACYRTYTALRLLVLGEERWRDVLEGRRDEDHDRAVVEGLLRKVLETAEEDVSETLKELEEEDTPQEQHGEEEAREKAIRGMLRERWAQIGELIAQGLARLEQVQ